MEKNGLFLTEDELHKIALMQEPDVVSEEKVKDIYKKKLFQVSTKRRESNTSDNAEDENLAIKIQQIVDGKQVYNFEELMNICSELGYGKHYSIVSEAYDETLSEILYGDCMLTYEEWLKKGPQEARNIVDKINKYIEKKGKDKLAFDPELEFSDGSYLRLEDWNPRDTYDMLKEEMCNYYLSGGLNDVIKKIPKDELKNLIVENEIIKLSSEEVGKVKETTSYKGISPNAKEEIDEVLGLNIKNYKVVI